MSRLPHVESTKLSIDVPKSSYFIPTRIHETSMSELIPMDISKNHSFTLTYQVVNNSTHRQNHKLIDSSGYSYTVKRKTGNATSWRCTVKNEVISCGATVKQCGGVFTVGHQSH